MKESDRSAILARLAAITPVHWVAATEIEPEDGGYWDPTLIYAVDELPVPDYPRGSPEAEAEAERVSRWADLHYRGDVAQTHNYFPIPDEQHDANQRFIAHAPDDLRALLGENERLRQLLTQAGIDPEAAW